jgi:hypothetical protein
LDVCLADVSTLQIIAAIQSIPPFQRFISRLDLILPSKEFSMPYQQQWVIDQSLSPIV